MAKNPPKSKVVGEADDWSEDDIGKLAEISPEDIASAKAHFKRVAPKKLKNVLDAKIPDGEDA